MLCRAWASLEPWARTLFEKVWDDHVVTSGEGRPDLLYVDLHLVHEVTSPQAFEGLRAAGRKVRRPDLTVATMDHNVATGDDTPADPLSQQQLETLAQNCEEFGVPLHATGSGREGIVHVIGPELGLTQPGKTIVCGDSHTSTHGAFGALAFGIGTSEVEHVLATQTLAQRRPRTLRIRFDGERAPGVTAKDLVLAAIGEIGVDGGVGQVIEYAGPAIEALSMEGRMTVCNMSIEAGARAGMIAPDETTFAYLRERGVEIDPRWRDLPSDPDAVFDREVVIDVAAVKPQVTWGTNPGMVASIDDVVPAARRRGGRARARRTWGSSRGRRSATSASTACSSARARTRASRTCARPPPSCRGGTCTRRCARWSCPGPRA